MQILRSQMNSFVARLSGIETEIEQLTQENQNLNAKVTTLEVENANLRAKSEAIEVALCEQLPGASICKSK